MLLRKSYKELNPGPPVGAFFVAYPLTLCPPMAAELVTIATTAALTQFVGPMFKHLGEQALERAKQVAGKASGLLAAVGREPQPVEPKLLVPLVQAAALESDESLSNKWAALLANAADPAQWVVMQPGFVEVLRQLTPSDAVVLSRIYQDVLVAEEALLTYEPPSVVTQGMHAELGLQQKQFAVSVDTLIRLRLCAVPGPVITGFAQGPNYAVALMVCPTVFGLEFLSACLPPVE